MMKTNKTSMRPAAYGPRGPRLSPPVSPAPKARRRALHWYPALGSGFGSRHGVFLLFGSTENSSSSSPSSSSHGNRLLYRSCRRVGAPGILQQDTECLPVNGLLFAAVYM